MLRLFSVLSENSIFWINHRIISNFLGIKHWVWLSLQNVRSRQYFRHAFPIYLVFGAAVSVFGEAVSAFFFGKKTSFLKKNFQKKPNEKNVQFIFISLQFSTHSFNIFHVFTSGVKMMQKTQRLLNSRTRGWRPNALGSFPSKQRRTFIIAWTPQYKGFEFWASICSPQISNFGSILVFS